MARAKAAPAEVESFEQLYAALEERARRLEQGNLPLEESLKLYEEAAALADRLRAILEAAELRVRTVQRRFDRDETELREIEAAYSAVEDDAFEDDPE